MYCLLFFTEARLYECEVCNKSFKTKQNLNVHRRIHTNEKPYCCTHCGRGFEHSGKLQRHVRTHTGERPHQCAVCEKSFIQSGQLIIHMRSHTGKRIICNTISSHLSKHFFMYKLNSLFLIIIANFKLNRREAFRVQCLQ